MLHPVGERVTDDADVIAGPDVEQARRLRRLGGGAEQDRSNEGGGDRGEGEAAESGHRTKASRDGRPGVGQGNYSRLGGGEQEAGKKSYAVSRGELRRQGCRSRARS